MQTTEQDEINLKELFALVWRGRWLVMATTIAFTAVATTAVLMVPKKYTASVVISPVSSTPGGGSLGGLSSLATQFGGLASLAGISIGGDSTKAEYVAVLQSEELTQKYIGDNDLLPVLFADLWDPVKRNWKTDDPKKLPTLWKGNQFFKKQVRSVTEDKKTGLINMEITWYDPQIAAKWANDLVKLTNDYLRAKKVRESERNIAYLKQEAAKTDMVQVRTAIYNVLESEIKAVMLAQGSDEYALRTIDPAVAPERSSSPKTLMWIAAGFVLGGIASLVFLLVRHAWAETVES